MSCCGFENATGISNEGGDFTTTSNVLYSEILINSNLCFSNSSNYTSNSSNFLFDYSSNNSNSLYNNTESTSNDFFNFSNQIKGWINSNEDSNYIYFNNSNNTIINSNSELYVYHTSNFLIPFDESKYWSVEDKLTSNIIETNLIKFDFSLLQSAITSLTSFISTIQSEVSALEASDVAMAASLVIIEQQIEGINAIIAGLDFSLNSLYPLEIIDKNIQLNYNTEQFNLTSSNLNIKSITQNIPANRATYTNGILNIINDTTAYIKYIENGSITFPLNTIIDILLVGAGGDGGGGFYSGGGGAGEVIYKTSYNINAGTYSIQIGQQSLITNDRISKIYQGGTNLILAKGGGDGGFYDKIIDSVYNYYLYKSVIGRVNNTNNFTLIQGGNKIIFSKGYIEINGVKDKSYPLLSTSPIYWYKFDVSAFLINNGVYGGAGDLTNTNASIDTTNFIKGTSSVYFNSFNNAFLSANVSLNLRYLQTTNGFSISFWTLLKPTNNVSSWILNIDNGINRTRFLAIGKYKQYLQFEVQYDNDYQYIRTDDDLINLYNNSWYFITLTFATNNDIKYYINNELKGTINFIFPNSNLTRFFIGGLPDNYFNGNVDDFRFYTSCLTLDEIKELYQGSIIINSLAQSGGSGGGAGDVSQSKGLKGTPFDINSKINDGYDFVNDLDPFGNPDINYGGGNGGSALANGDGYTELITGNNLIVGKGGFGNTNDYYYPENKNNYGDGGDGNGGVGFQGVIIIKLPYEAPQTTFNGYTYWSNINGITTTSPISLSGLKEIGLSYDNTLTLNGNQLSVASGSGSKWTELNNHIYNNNSGNVGIGLTNPISLLHLHKIDTGQDVRFVLSDGTTGKGLNDGFQIIKATNQDGYIWNYENNALRFGTNNQEKFTILNNGSIGINNNTPSSSYKLDIGGNVNLSSTNDYYRNGVSLTTTFGTKQDNLTFTQPLNNSTNTISLNYDSTLSLTGNNLGVATSTKSKWAKRPSPYPAIDDIYNINTRYVGIGTSEPSVKLDVLGDFTCIGTCSINYNDNDQAYFSMINNFQGANASVRFYFTTYSTQGSIDLFNSLHTTTPDLLKINNTLGDIMIANGVPTPYIYIKKSTSRVGINKNNPSYTLDIDGSLNSTSLYLGTRLIQDHLFNNCGRVYGTYHNFNTPTDFGFHFIDGVANGPNVNDAGSYYTLSMGLGSEYYSGSGVGNYRLQLAFPRSIDAYPYLTYRLMENNSWGGWKKLRAGYCDTAVESGKTYQFEPFIDTWHYSRVDNVNRFYFYNTGSTLFGTGDGYAFRHATDGTDLFIIYNNGWIKGRFQSVTNTGTDYLGVQVNTTSTGGTWFETIKIIYGSFTQFHRFFCDDDLFDRTNEDTMNDFKNNYIGRVVCSTGKIKTHSQKKGDNEPWFIQEDKDGITIEDAHCVVRLSNKKKDKSVVGVIGLNRNNSAPDRIIVNSIGEGAIMVLNTNGNVENGDLLQTSEHLGYAEKQDDDIIRNYTIGKVMIDCNFELNSLYYESIDLGNGIICAFLPCFYYCG